MANDYKKTLNQVEDLLRTEKPPKSNFTYTLIHGQRKGRGDFEFIQKKTFLLLSLANEETLELFTKRFSKGIASKPSFVDLKSKVGIDNKKFIRLHSVRPNEIGYRFDTHGCLSPYSAFHVGETVDVDSVSVVESRLKEVIFFVRQVVKVEIELN